VDADLVVRPSVQLRAGDVREFVRPAFEAAGYPPRARSAGSFSPLPDSMGNHLAGSDDKDDQREGNAQWQVAGRPHGDRGQTGPDDRG
jgi:hypothetical protein